MTRSSLFRSPRRPRESARVRQAWRRSRAQARSGFTLAEAMVALLILGLTALAAASAEAWAARTTAAAEAREDAATAAQLIADSLALVAAPAAGSTVVDGLEVRWDVDRADSAATVSLRLHVRPLSRPLARGRGEEDFGAVLAPPPPSLESAQ